eukprot:scaffold6767_cov223-Isochrysis_galbana.AAC.21
MAHPLTRVASHHLTPAHWAIGPAHLIILTTPHHHHTQHPDCFRCLAAPPRERAKPGGLNCQRNAQLQPATACLPACTPRQPDGCIASKDVTEATSHQLYTLWPLSLE